MTIDSGCTLRWAIDPRKNSSARPTGKPNLEAFWVGVRPIDRRGQRGKNGSVRPPGTIGRDTEGSVMMKAAPASSFVVVQSKFLLELFVITLDDPAVLRHSH